jgi:hypothetical protein
VFYQVTVIKYQLSAQRLDDNKVVTDAADGDQIAKGINKIELSLQKDRKPRLVILNYP